MELDLVNSMKRTLKRHEADEKKEGFKWEQWQSAKLRNLRQYRKENQKIVADYSKDIEKAVTKSINGKYKEGQNVFEKLIKSITSAITRKKPFHASEEKKDTDTPFEKQVEKKEEDFFHMNDKKIKALEYTVNNDLKDAQTAALRKMDDVYRQTIYKASVYVASGAKTLESAIDMATKEFLKAGINCVEYSDGKRVNIASYAEMALRTASHRAFLLGEGKKRAEMGIYTVFVSAHANTCEKCEPWQSKVLIDDVFSGLVKAKAEDLEKETGYPLLSKAIEAGLLHPNCRHSISTYFPGITILPTVPDDGEAIKRYAAEQKQRSLERTIREWRRIAAGSLEPDKIKTATEKVSKYQGLLNTHLSEHPYLRRDRTREQTKGIK